MSISIPEEIIANPEKTAKAVGLRYTSDNVPGIKRYKRGKGFYYIDLEGKECTDEETLARIKKLVIPPGWENVWICPIPNGHLQATGYDTKNRKQYRYHPEWNQVRNQTKYFRILQFGSMLPIIRQRIEKDITSPELTQEKVLATVVSLMERTFIRIGNSSYKKLYGSYGLTTLRDKHVKINGSNITFEFKGKKGVYHTIALKSKKLASIVKKCRDLPGYELFQYIDGTGNKKSIESGMVNSYLKEITGCDFTSKDFRTWAGTVNALKAFREIGDHNSATEAKKNIVKAIDRVSKQLGNTRSVCKKYYIHPTVINAYEEGCLMEYFKELDQIEENDGTADLTCEEKLLMKLLETLQENEIKLPKAG